MQENNNSYTFISVENTDFQSFFTSFSSEITEYTNQHIILELQIEVTAQDIAELEAIANQKREENTSFVVISKNVDIDDVPETINITPTLEEAEDVLQMDAISRDLGF